MAANVIFNAEEFVAKDYDIVIVGGGTAGLTLATRLAQHQNLTIGVLEAGPDLSNEEPVATGGGWLAAIGEPKYFWGFTSSPQQNLLDKTDDGVVAGRSIPLPRGKLLGGSGSINFMTFMRASREEYDTLETTFGNPGWNFDALLPYFKKTQSHTPLGSKLFPGYGILQPSQGSDGPIKTSYNWWHSSLTEPFIRTLQAASFTINDDPDGGISTGIVDATRNVDPETALRTNSVHAYLKAFAPTNVTVLSGAHARRVTFESDCETTADGLEFQCQGKTYTVKAKKEVILCAGSFQTPQLLELSGIGMRSVLEKFGIPVRLELPVGENLQDHMMIMRPYELKDEQTLKASRVLPEGFTVKYVGEPGSAMEKLSPQQSVTASPCLVSRMRDMEVDGIQNVVPKLVEILDGYLTRPGLSDLTRTQYEVQRKWLTEEASKAADGIIVFQSVPGLAATPSPTGGMSLWFPTTMFHPTSRGSVHITSKDPLVPPEIAHNCLDEFDSEAFLRMMKFEDELLRKEPMNSIIAHGPPRTDAELLQQVRSESITMGHPIGTAPMCKKELGGVVDPELKVYGTTNLRVVDASIFPLQLGATPQGTIYALAEKAADIIKKSS